MKRLVIFLFAALSISSHAQDKPKLVVGIVVDQMRQEYLYRYEKKFTPGGFKRLIGEGFMLKNAHYNYVPTFTGPGHASVYTGSTPAVHGIIGNDWFDKTTKKDVNCVGDENQKPVGDDKGNGDVSPWRLLSTTITDELKLATQKQAKVIGLSLKDRGAVLPAGHMADGAYWFDGPSGKFISSTFYKPGLPLWLEKFNATNPSGKYFEQEWKTLLPIEQYTESGPDDSPYESKLRQGEPPVFPYKLKEMRPKYASNDLIASTGFGADMLTEAAKLAIDGEELGKDNITDFLAVSYSSPDIVGHAMGPNSIEVEDVYLRLDRNIADLLTELDKKVGQGQYTVFLTADHAVADVPMYLKDNKVPAGNFRQAFVEAGLIDHLKKYFPDKKIIEKIINDQIFLNQEAFAGGDPKTAGVDMLVATELISQYLMRVEGVAAVYSANTLKASDYGEKGLKGNLVRGYNHKRSGDIVYVLQPGWINWAGTVGTTHGSGYTYDTHVPILFYGWGVKKGSSSQPHTITDIAPTLSVLLSIKFPSGCTGQPITEIVD